MEETKGASACCCPGRSFLLVMAGMLFGVGFRGRWGPSTLHGRLALAEFAQTVRGVDCGRILLGKLCAVADGSSVVGVFLPLILVTVEDAEDFVFLFSLRRLFLTARGLLNGGPLLRRSSLACYGASGGLVFVVKVGRFGVSRIIIRYAASPSVLPSIASCSRAGAKSGSTSGNTIPRG
jgi:hypothetical protein